MLALEPEGRLIFSAADAEGSLEPWMSDGTPEGTVRIEDLAPGLLSSNPSGFARVGDRVYFSANEGSLGQELWSLPPSELYDRTPPELTCPDAVKVESADGPARPVEYPPATARDAYTASPVITYSQPSGSTFAVGDTSVTVTATDERGNCATCSFTVSVKAPASSPDPEPTEPTGGCGCGASGMGAPGWVLGLGAWLARRRKGAALRR
jgi:ELWxxDGT repeat protein